MYGTILCTPLPTSRFWGAEDCLIDLLSLLPHSPSCINSFGMVSSLQNELYSDDTMPKTIDIRRLCRVGVKVCNDLPKPPKTSCREGDFSPYSHSYIPFLYQWFLALCYPYSHPSHDFLFTVLLIFPSHYKC